MQLQTEDFHEILSSCPRDTQQCVRGPVTVSDHWLEELSRIDDRLALRWMPKAGLYAVWLRLERTDRFWPQAVHWIHDGNRGFRAPDNRDLHAIRKARYYAERSGARAQIDAMDRRLAEEQRGDSERRERIVRQHVAEAARRHDLTLADLGMTAKPFAANARARANLQTA